MAFYSLPRWEHTVLTDARFDFRGGRNSANSPDSLSVNELVNATNARLTVEYGAFAKRTGTRRLHATALGLPSTINGLTQWDGPSGKQVVAVCGGDLYYRNASTGDFGAFTKLTSGLFSTTLPASFATFRANSSGAPLQLFIASGGKYFSWDGTATLTRLDGTKSAPTATLLFPYHTRMFAVDNINLPKTVYWSVTGDATDFTPALGTGGGSALVDVLTGDTILALESVGSSLALATSHSLVRFTGHDSEDIVISQDTEGIATEVGVVSQQAITRIETFGAVLSDKGPYIFNEATVTPIGIKVEPDFDALDRTQLSKVCLGWHRGRKELYYVLNNTAYVYSARLQAWMGPWTYPFTITCLSRFVDANGDDWLMAGCSDGFVRHLDTGALDDVLSGGTGGSNITMTVELPPIFFDSGPGTVKALKRFRLQAQLSATTALQVQCGFDGAALTPYAVTGLSGSNVLDYRIDATGQGHRLRVVLTDASADLPLVAGLVTEAFDYGYRY